MRSVAWGTLVLSAAGFAGCVVREKDHRTTVRFAVWATAAQQRVEEEIIREFERSQPDVRVELLAFEFSSFDAKVQAMMVGGEAPDVMLVKNSTYDDWAARSVLADLTPLVQAMDRADELMPAARTIFERNGRYFAFPVNVHGLVTYVNLDALAAAGVTLPADGLSWDEIWKIAPRLSRRAGNPRAPTDYALLEPPPYPVLEEFGGALFDDSHRPTKVVIDSAPGRAWVEWCQRLASSGWCAPRATASDQGTYQLFRDGRVALFFSGRWQVPDFAGHTGFNWDVRPFPSGPHGRTTMHGGTGIAVAAASRAPDAARQFAQFYAGRRGAEIAMRAGRTVPVQRGLAHSAEFLGLHPPASPQYFVDTMEAGAASYWLYAPGAPEVSKIVTSRMDEALSDPSLSASVVTKRMHDDLVRWLARQQRAGLIPSP
ncbi:MAG: putative sugar transporter sugar-binding protein [Verrucomicrobia bacterium]|nr:putative sugar transporter sugar-binding protein [Verrucomicrobiota bacterium]